MGASSKLLSHTSVHGYHDLLLVGHERVPLLHLLANPVLERVAQDCGANVDDPLLRDLGQVDVVREVVLEPWLLRREGKDLLDREVLVLGHVDRLHGVDVDVRFPLREDVLEEVNGSVV